MSESALPPVPPLVPSEAAGRDPRLGHQRAERDGESAPAIKPASAAELCWFALWTRSRHEQVVREQLEQKQIEAFLPTVTRWSRWKDRKKKIDWPLFPGYCFARFDPRAARLPVLKCTGVVSIISFEGGEPAPIPEHEIVGIRQLVESDLAFDPCPMIREGMMVEVVHGPLKGVVGRLVRKNEKARLVLSVEMIGQAVSVEVDAADVRAY
jgi:transcription termination/antitermination protein NusG